MKNNENDEKIAERLLEYKGRGYDAVLGFVSGVLMFEGYRKTSEVLWDLMENLREGGENR